MKLKKELTFLDVFCIATGAMIVKEIIDFFKKKEFFVSDRGFQFGVLMQHEEEIQRML